MCASFTEFFWIVSVELWVMKEAGRWRLTHKVLYFRWRRRESSSGHGEASHLNAGTLTPPPRDVSSGLLLLWGNAKSLK